MLVRFVIMVLLLGLRLVTNLLISGFVCLPGHEIRLAGKVETTYLNTSERINRVGVFWWTGKGDRVASREDRVQIAGKCESEVISRMLGQIWLAEAQLDLLSSEVGRQDLSEKLRKVVESVWYRYLPPTEAGLVSGIVLGDKGAVSSDLYRQMKETGLVHIAVASGYNISAVVDTLICILIVFVSRRWSMVVAIFFAAAYAVLVGLEAPIVRALLMACLAIGARLTGRRTGGVWIWWVVVWLMVMLDPAQVAEVSFQLTAMATFGLLVVEPRLRHVASHLGGIPSGYPPRSKAAIPGGKLADVLGVWQSAAAQVAVAPILWWHFGQFKLIGLVTNMIVIVVPWIMFGGVASLLFGWIPVLGTVVNWWTWVWAHLLVMWVEWWAI